ncbi:MAG TPA: metallophosphoesterase [Gaiellaceae bacterium]|nr:metallophosphoesterase [Gaiellaceae bacterium]
MVPAGSLFAGALASLTIAASPAAAQTGVVAIGDFGVGGERQASMGDAVERFVRPRLADALVTLGDNDYTESPQAFRRNWRRSFGWAAETGLQVAGALGNHDHRVDGGRYEFEALGMPRRYYHRRVGDVEFFLLDSTKLGVRQAGWLERRLAASTAPWKVVVLHHPPFTCGTYRGDRALRRLLMPVLARNDVDLVLSGHDHNYQRFEARRGVTFVVHGGGGGAGLNPLSACPEGYPRRVRARSRHGWVYLRAGPAAMRVRAIAPDGSRYDSFRLYP